MGPMDVYLLTNDKLCGSPVTALISTCRNDNLRRLVSALALLAAGAKVR
jgi:hypothetical protein